MSQSIHRSWWLPLLLAFVGAIVAVGIGMLGSDTVADAQAVVRIGEVNGPVVSATEHSTATSSAVRQRASDALAASGVELSTSELLGRTDVEVDANTGLVTFTVDGASGDATASALAMAEAYLAERVVAAETAREQRALFLAEESATITRDLLSANLTIGTARDDTRELERLEGRLLALEVERDRLQLNAEPTNDVERQIADLRLTLDTREPAIDQVDLARAEATSSLLTAQLETIRSELTDMSVPLGSSGEVIETTTAAPAGDSSGLDVMLLLLLAVSGFVLGLVLVVAMHLVEPAQAAPVSARPAPPAPRIVSNAPAAPAPAPMVDILPAPPATSRRASDLGAAEGPEEIVPHTPAAPTVSDPRESTSGNESEPSATPTPIMASVPAPESSHVHPVTINHPDSEAADAYRSLAERLIADVEGAPSPTVAFVGPGVGTGRTTVAVNVAAAAVSEGYKTLLVSPLWEEIEIPGLPVLPPGLGITEPQSFPPAEDFRAALNDVASMIDIVFVDTVAADANPEMVDIAAEADLVALVVMTGRSNVASVSDVEAELRARGATVAGVIVNAHEAHAGV